MHVYLGVAPLSDALPAEEVSTGGGGAVSPGLQAEDAPGGGAAGWSPRALAGPAAAGQHDTGKPLHMSLTSSYNPQHSTWPNVAQPDESTQFVQRRTPQVIAI